MPRALIVPNCTHCPFGVDSGRVHGVPVVTCTAVPEDERTGNVIQMRWTTVPNGVDFTPKWCPLPRIELPPSVELLDVEVS